MGKKAKTVDPLAAVKANPAKVTALMLNPAASRNAGNGLYDPYPVFPPEILACKNLVVLEIFRGIRGNGTIPDELGTLTKLKHLTLGGLETTVLPATIGKLVKLEHLSLAYMESLETLPASIGKLAKLVELDAPYAGIRALPPMGGLAALKKANFSNAKLVSIHPTLWNCTKLEELYLPDSIKTLPPGIAKLTKLRKLSCSVPALISIARELSKLKLVQLGVNGDSSDSTQLPDEVGEITSLERLSASYVGLTSLPPSITSLAKLVELEVSGNKLSTLIDIIAGFPKLASFEYSGNPVAVSERREIDKLMKLSPAKRAAALAKRTPAPIKTKPAPVKLTPIGQVASVNASLSFIIADAKVAAAWSGIGDGDDLDGTDWDRARLALAKKDYAMVDVGTQSAVALSLGIGQGIADVFRIGERIVVVESIADNTEDELFLEYVASAPQKPKSVANLAIPSKKLVIVPTTDAGDSDESLSIDVPAKISILIEATITSSWGHARRFFVTPA